MHRTDTTLGGLDINLEADILVMMARNTFSDFVCRMLLAAGMFNILSTNNN